MSQMLADLGGGVNDHEPVAELPYDCPPWLLHELWAIANDANEPTRVKIEALKLLALIARVSTDEQTHGSQITELREYCARRCWEEVEEIADTVSGAKTSRQGLDRLMQAVRCGKVDVVLCYKLDRLGRSLSHLVQLVDEFRANRVALIVPGQGIDTSDTNPCAKFQLDILAAVCELERGLIRERVHAGMAAARARGVHLGRPPTLHEHMEAVRVLREAGQSIREIGKQLKLQPSSVMKVLRLAAQAS
jgi:DNA invertase Pin-like site-specific DNA recombinase